MLERVALVVGVAGALAVFVVGLRYLGQITLGPEIDPYTGRPLPTPFIYYALEGFLALMGIGVYGGLGAYLVYWIVTGH